MRDLIFHFGLWKTGTTFLQKKVFSGSGFGGKYNTGNDLLNEFNRSFIQCSPEFWETKSGVDLLGRVFGDVGVFSAENFYRAKIFLPGINNWRGYDHFSLRYQLDEMSKSLAKNFDLNLKLFYFFRKQPEWLASMYSELSQYQVGCSTEDFEEKVTKMLENPYLLGDNLLFYGDLYKALVSALGNENVEAFPYERFNDYIVWRRICDFCGIDEEKIKGIDFSERINVKNSGSKKGQTWALYEKGNREPSERVLELNGELESKILKHYKEKNKEFSDLLGDDLSLLGYY